MAINLRDLVLLRLYQQRTVPQTTLFVQTWVRFGKQRSHYLNELRSDISRVCIKSASVKAPAV